MRLSLALFTVSLLAAPRVPAQEPILRVELPTRAVQLPLAALRALPTDTVRFAAHNAPSHLYSAVPLVAVLGAAGFPVDSLRVGRAAWVVVAVAADGYLVTFSAAELDPKLGSTRAFLAFGADGKELPPAEAPFRLIVSSDHRAARSGHQIVRIRVFNAWTP